MLGCLLIKFALKRINLRKTLFMELFNLKPIAKVDFYKLFESSISKRSIRRKVKQAEIDSNLASSKRHYYFPGEYFKIITAMDENFIDLVKTNNGLFFGL